MGMFYDLLKAQLITESSNYYTDNRDPYANEKKGSLKRTLVNFLKRFFYSKPMITILVSNDKIFKKYFLGKLFNLEKYLDALDNFYKKLEDDKSKKLLLKLVAFRILGYVKVKLPLSNKAYWDGLDKIIENEGDDFFTLEYEPFKLPFHDLNNIGLAFKLYLHSKALYMTFITKHYNHVVNEDLTIKVEEKDVVLDLGGCYGDSALYFADLCGEKGKVFCFEFIPSNLKVLNKNLELNPELRSRIEIVDNPLWDVSGKQVYYKDLGASSKVGFEDDGDMSGKTETLSIDDFVANNNLKSVDFIKTDIEGAEPFAIDGAVKTIQSFKPKLAISIYHNMSDFTGLVQKIDSLNVGYKFYLGHATIYSSETVLFCKVD